MRRSRPNGTRCWPGRRRTRTKATRSRRHAAGCRWWRSTSTLTLVGPNGPVTLLETFEGRRQLIAYYHMWHVGAARPPASARAAPSSTARYASWPTCTRAMSRTPRSVRAPTRRACAIATSWAGTCPGTRPEIRPRRCSPVADSTEPAWCAICDTTSGCSRPTGPVGAALRSWLRPTGSLDMTVYGRQESWEDSPDTWPRRWERGANPFRTNGRPTAQWSRLQAGRSDDLTS